MAWSESEKTIVIAILLIVLAVTLFIELRYFRGRSRVVKRVSQRKDEAYNAVLTTRAVVNVMKRQGKDTEPAQVMLTNAKKALERGDYVRCMDLCDSARGELTRAREAPVLPQEDKEPIDVLADRILSGKPAPQPRPAEDYKGALLAVDRDSNFLQARFEIGTARSELDRAAKGGSDVAAAESTLVEAENEFTARNYTKALSLAVRARKMLSGDVTIEAIPLRKEPTPVEELTEMASSAEPQASVPEGEACSSCGELLTPEDRFCGTCGTTVVKEVFCGNCGAPTKPKDKFCRKCGLKLG